MENEINLPDELVKYILFQRTGHLKYANAKIFKLLSKYTSLPAYEKMVAWEAAARTEEIKKAYRQDIYHE